MNTIKNTARTSTLISSAILTSLLLAACIREYPEDGREVNPTDIQLTLELSTALPISPSNVSDYIYFVAGLYSSHNTSEPVFRYEDGVERNSLGTASINISTSIHAGEYILAAFAVSCNDSTGSDSVYELSDLSNITFTDGIYPGSTPLKECYSLRMDIDLPYEVWFASDTVRGELSAPVGKVEVISDDAAEFARKYIIGEENTAPGADTRNWANYELHWNYSLYCPTGFNAVTGLPNKSETGVGFISALTPVNENEILLGYDYVFVNGDNTTVNLILSLYDKDTDELLNTCGGIEAEIVKGGSTTLRGKFLTTNREPGVGIDPGFDGDIDITLP